MQRTIFLTAITAIFVLGGCGSFYGTESRITSKNWVSSPWVAQFKGDLPPDNTPVPYCYNTLGTVECRSTPLGNRDAGRYVNSYTGATPRPDDPKSGFVEWATDRIDRWTDSDSTDSMDSRVAANSRVEEESAPEDAEKIPPATAVRKVPVKSPPTWSD